MTLVLEAVDLAEVQNVLAPLCGRFNEIRVFGSRATGRSSPTSDIDLVVFGADRPTLSAIIEALDESLLPMTADVVAYETITNERLRDHIDRVALPLPLRPALDGIASVAAE